MRRVEKWSLGYELLRTLARIVYRATYKNITVTGLENVPLNEPVILAPNHQNALDDPLALNLTNSKFQPVFLARADIFKNKIIARLLNFLKIGPVYRIRDGKDSLDKNKEVFDNSVRVLANNKILCLFPEAQHIGMKSMVAHKKAVPRIVFIAARQTNFSLNIKIVPVGINYSHYYNFRRRIVVNFGEPLSSADYYQMYNNEGEVKASSELRNDLFNAVEKLVVHVPDKQMYDLYEQGFEIASREACNKLKIKNCDKYFFTSEKFITRKITEWLDSNEEKASELLEKASRYKKLKTKLRLTENCIQKGSIGFFSAFFKSIYALLLMLIGLPGAIMHGGVFYLTRYPYRKLIKDKQFYSSVSIGLSIIVYPLWHIALFFILNAFIDKALLSLAIVLLSVPSGIIAWEAYQKIMCIIKRIKISRLKKGRNQSLKLLLNLRSELSEFYSQRIGEKL